MYILVITQMVGDTSA